MISFFKRSPEKKIQKTIDRLYEKAVHFQRNGNLREYAKLIKEIEELRKKITTSV